MTVALEQTSRESVAESPASVPDTSGNLPVTRSVAAALLVVLTLFAGFLRFAWIDKPACWNDEAHVFRRVTGTFQDLLDLLQSDGFGPLHYELYWALGHWKPPTLKRLVSGLRNGDLGYDDFWGGNPATLTPFWMRLVPSLAGMAMVPAMYFLARQMCSRRTSLLAAALAACSAYLMVYSHDGKMYMHLWLFCALNIGCLLWWLRTSRRIAWLSWIAAGLALGGLHAPGLLVLGLQPLFLITQRRHRWQNYVLFVLGAAVIAAGPAMHYLRYNRWTERVEETGWGASGLGWVPGVLSGRSGPNLALFATSAYLYSWEWTRETYDDDKQYPIPRRSSPTYAEEANRYMQVGFSQMLQGFHIDPRVRTGLMCAVVIILALAAAGAFPWPRVFRGETPEDPPVAAWWQTAFWTAAWMCLPAYLFYCASVRDYASPVDWLNEARSYLHGLFASSGTIVKGYPALLKAHWPVFAGIAAVVAALAAVWRRLPGLARVLAVEVLLIAALVIILRPLAFNPFNPPDKWWLIPREAGQRAADIISDPRAALPAVVIIPLAAWWMCGRSIVQRTLRTLQLLAVVAAVWGLCWLIWKGFELRGPSDNGPIWMPRYIAIVWPAFAVALCALIMRLPAPVLRWTAICILLGTNLAQSWGRMFAGSEPRVDLMMRDVVAADDFNSPLRTYIQGGPETAHPAGGTVDNRPGKYYVCITTGRIAEPFTPKYFLAARTTQALKTQTIHRYTTPQALAADARLPQLRRIIVWERILERPGPNERDEILDALGDGWAKAAPDELYPVRYHWNWSEIYISRRREYVRKSGA